MTDLGLQPNSRGSIPLTEDGCWIRVWVGDVLTPDGTRIKVDLGGASLSLDTSALLTDAQLRAAPVPVSGSFWPATQPVSGSVSVSNLPATQPISGSVAVSNFPSSFVATGPLTDTQLRAAAVPVSGTFWQATQPVSAAALPLPSGAATETTLGTRLADSTFTARMPTLGQKAAAGSVPVVLASDQPGVPVTGTFWPATQPVSGTVAVSNFPASQPVTGTFWQATQPISAASLPLPSGAAQDATLTGGTQKAIVRGGAKGATTAADVTSTAVDANTQALDVAIKGTPAVTATCSGTVAVSNFPASQTVAGTVAVSNFPATQPVSGTVNATCSGTVGVSNFPASQAVTGTFWQATQPISAAALPLPTGAAQDATLTGGTQRTKITDGTNNAALAASSPAGTEQGLVVRGIPMATSLCVTATAAAGSAVTLTLPAVAGQFHYITGIRIEAYNTAARTAGATPVLVTSTNLPGSPVWTFGTAGAIGTIEGKQDQPCAPMKSSAVNTATTIVAPATSLVIWCITVTYYAAP